jgi:hypothetical protein
MPALRSRPIIRIRKPYSYVSACKVCGTNFSGISHHYQPPKYCSRACRWKAQFAHTVHVCPVCKKEFGGFGRAKIYCSRECYWNLRRRAISDPKFHASNPWARRLPTRQQHKAWVRRAARKWSLMHSIYTQCAHCLKTFRHTRKGNCKGIRKYCSKACYFHDRLTGTGGRPQACLQHCIRIGQYKKEWTKKPLLAINQKDFEGKAAPYRDLLPSDYRHHGMQMDNKTEPPR